MSTTPRPVHGDSDTASSRFTDAELTRLFGNPAVPLSQRIDRVCREMLAYTATVDWILAETRCSGPSTVPRLADHLDRAYHRACADLPEDVIRSLAVARGQRGLISASLVGIGTVTAPSAVELLPALHWKAHNLLLHVAGPDGHGSAIWPTDQDGRLVSDTIYLPDGFSVGRLAGWLIAARPKVVPVLIEWRRETERLAAEVRWERIAISATLGGVPWLVLRSPSPFISFGNRPETQSTQPQEVCSVSVSVDTIYLDGKPLGTLTPNERKVWAALYEAFPSGLITPELARRSEAAQPGRHVKDVIKRHRELEGYVDIPRKGKSSTPQMYRLRSPR